MKRIYPIYLNKKSPCYSVDHLGNEGCPARSDIARFLYSVKLKEYRKAFEILKETNPFSGGCGRFCDHPCETACNRDKYDGAVDIREIERFVSDYGYKNNILGSRRKKSEIKGRVAIIGGGPGGLSCGYFLAREGYEVDVYERESYAGGILVEGIPLFRYPEEVREYEIEYVKSCGVNIHTDVKVDWQVLQGFVKDYAAVIVATGAHKARKLGVAGDELKGVVVGLDFLKRLHFDEDFKREKYSHLLNKFGLGKELAVIGGGYTAFDVARSGVRLGGNMHIYYRRSIAEMTAHPGEVSEAQKEGIGFSFLTKPTKLEKLSNGRIKMTMQRMELVGEDEGGRRSPRPIEGSEYAVEVDNVLSAIGETPELDFLDGDYKIEGFKLLLEKLGHEERDKVFITGDALQGHVSSTGMVVRAVGLAQDTVIEVRNFLGEEVMRNEEKEGEREIAYYDSIKKRYFPKESRLRIDVLPYEERAGNFKEVNLGITEEVAVSKAGRCWNCGICIQCDWCRDYDNETILKLTLPWSEDKEAHFYKFLKERVSLKTRESVEGCPRNAMALVPYDEEWKKVIESQYISFDSIKY